MAINEVGSKPTIYIAASSRELDRAKLAFARAQTAGFEIAYDWITDVEREGSSNDVPDDVAFRCAVSDLKAAVEADHFWALSTNSYSSRGQHVEIGARIAVRGHASIVLSGERVPCIFLAGILRFETDSEALAYLRGKAAL
jgi:hypothetical protein